LLIAAYAVAEVIVGGQIVGFESRPKARISKGVRCWWLRP